MSAVSLIQIYNRIDDIQFVGNTAKEGSEAKAEVKNIVCDIIEELEELTEKLDLSQKENVNLRREIQAIEFNYDALQSPMPCGHLARYAVNGEEGTGYCALCLVSAVTGTNDAKIQNQIAEIISHE